MINVGALNVTLDIADGATQKLRQFDAQVAATDHRLGSLTTNVNTLGLRLQASGAHISRAGDRLTYLSGALIATGVGAVRLATSFEREMTKVVNLTEIGEDAMTNMRDRVLELGPAVGRGPQELAEALYAIGSVGVVGANALSTLERSAKASAVGLGNTEDIARAVVAAMKAYGEENLTAARATDILLYAVKEGGAEADQFANTLGRVIATAKLVGLSFEEVTGSVATFTRLGVRADEAVTALRGTMRVLMRPSEQAREELDRLGTSIDQLRKKVREDGAADALIELIELAKKVRPDDFEEAIGNIVPNVRALAGVLANANSQADTYRKIVRGAADSTGSLDLAFARVSETGAFKFSQFWAKVQTTVIAVGDRLAPALLTAADAAKPLLNVVEDLVRGFAMLPQPIQTTVLGIGALALATAPVMSIGGRFIEFIGVMIGPRGLKGLVAILKDAALAYGLMTAAAEANTVAVGANAAATAASTVSNVVNATSWAKVAKEASETAATVILANRGFGLARDAAGDLAKQLTIGAGAGGAMSTALVPIPHFADEAASGAARLRQAIKEMHLEGTVLLRGGVLDFAKPREGLTLYTASLGLARGALTALGGSALLTTGVIAGVFTGGVVAAAAMTDRLTEVKVAAGQIPEVFNLLGRGLYAGVILTFQQAKYQIEQFIETLGLLKATAQQVFPSAFSAVGSVIDQKVREWMIAVEFLKQGVRDAELLAGLTPPQSGLATQIVEDASRQHAAMLEGYKKQLDLSNVASKEQREEATKLIEAYNELTTTTDGYGRQMAMSAEVTQILVDKFIALRDAGAKLPKDIEIFIKVNRIPVGSGGMEAMTFNEWARTAAEGGKVMLGGLRSEAETGRQELARARQAFEGLSPQDKADMQFRVANANLLGDTIPKLAERYKHLFGSTRLAEIALKQLGATSKETANAGARENAWVETFRVNMVELESQLAAAAARKFPLSTVAEEFKSQIEAVRDKAPMFIGLVSEAGRKIGEIGPHTQDAIKALADLEARKPFEQFAVQAARLELVLQSAEAAGYSSAAIVDIWGNSIQNITDKAPAMGQAIGDATNRARQALDDAQLDKILEEFDEELFDFAKRVGRTAATPAEQTELAGMAERWREQGQAIAEAARQRGLNGAQIEKLKRQLQEERERLEENTRAYISNMQAIKASERAIEDMSHAFDAPTLTNQLAAVGREFERRREDISATEQSAENYQRRMEVLAREEIAARQNVAQAWLRGNAMTRADLAAMAVDAANRYEFMRKSGLFAAQDIEQAWHAMVEANIAAQDTWSKHYVELVANMPDVIAGAFGEMMREAENFRDFFKGVWNAIRDEVFDVFEQIVQQFIRNTLQRVLGGLLGAKSAVPGGLGGLLQQGLTGAAPTGMLAGAGALLPGTLASGGVGPVTLGLPGQLPGQQFVATPEGLVPAGGGGLFSAGATNWGAVAGGGLMAGAGIYGLTQAEGTVQNTMSGAMAGAGIGTMIAPGIGTAIGAGIGALGGLIKGLFSTPTWEKITKEVGRNMGVNISKGLAEEIANLSKTIEGGTGQQRRELASLLSLDKIIAEAGGLTGSNVAKFEQQALGLFRPIETGMKEAGAATQQLNLLIGQFAAQADKTGGLWSKNLRDIIQRARDLKLDMENLTAALDAQVSKIGGGLAKMTAGFVANLDNAFKMAGDGIEDEIDEIVLTSQAQFDRLSRLILAGFNAAIAAGKSPLEAIDSVGEAIDALIEQRKRLGGVTEGVGLASNAAFEQLERWRSLTENNRALIESVVGINDVMVGLANLGSLSADIFSDLQAEAVNSSGAMLEAGFTQEEMLTFLKPTLETILRLHKERGLAIDDETQALIDQAREHGILQEQISLQDILIAGLGAIIEALGHELPEAFKNFKNAGVDAANGVSDAVNKIPKKVDINIDYEYTGEPPDYDPSDPNWRPDRDRASLAAMGGLAAAGRIIPFPMINATHMAGGSVGTAAATTSAKIIKFEPRGSDVVPAMLDPKEIVVNTLQQEALGRRLASGNYAEAALDTLFQRFSTLTEALQQDRGAIRPLAEETLRVVSSEEHQQTIEVGGIRVEIDARGAQFDGETPEQLATEIAEEVAQKLPDIIGRGGKLQTRWKTAVNE